MMMNRTLVGIALLFLIGFIATSFSPAAGTGAPLTPGALSVTSVPGGAAVSLNGLSYGNTPVTVGDLAPGRYTVCLTYPDYQPWIKKVRVKPGRVTAVKTARMKPNFGTLVILSDPAPATVTLDGKEIGETPVTWDHALLGAHTVQVMVAGYFPYTKTPRVRSGKTTTVRARMRALPLPTPAPGELTPVESAVLNYTNLERTTRGIPPLKVNQGLLDVSRDLSGEMKAYNFFSHTSPVSGSFTTRMRAHGFSCAAAENIAWTSYFGPSSVPDAVGRSIVQDQWMRSSGHRANILSPGYTSIGIGVVYDGNYAAEPYGFIATQDFAAI